MLRFCKNCGLLVPHDAQTCPQCGMSVPAAAQPAQSHAPAPLYDTAPDTADEPPVQALSQSATAVALIVFAIPVVGLVVALVWALGGTQNTARKRLARAQLIRTAVVAVAFVLFLLTAALVFSAVLQAGASYYYSNPYFW